MTTEEALRSLHEKELHDERHALQKAIVEAESRQTRAEDRAERAERRAAARKPSDSTVYHQETDHERN